MICDTTPTKLTGKEFEELILFRARQLEDQGKLTLGRYGVQASIRKDATGNVVWQPLKSYPDFDGCIAPHGRELIVEAKVCSSVSLAFHDSKTSTKQIDHMIKRARFGSLCFLLLHFNERRLKTRTDAALTYAVPVHPDHPYWIAHAVGEEKNLTRQQADLYGIPVPWRVPDGCRKVTPGIEVMVSGTVEM